MMIETPLPLGKLPPNLLSRILADAPISDPRLILGPGIGLDCAVITLGKTCLIFKSDPITYTSEEIGWYAVHINANDIVTTGATPRWFLATLLLPEVGTTAGLVEEINQQIFNACRSLDISVIGGHTEITYGINRPILTGTMIGEVPTEKLITPRGASPGDHILITKGVPIEGIAILARELPEQLRRVCTDEEIQTARNFLYDPGISIYKDAQVASEAGTVTAMHDPTEGGIASALWELAEACGNTMVIDPSAIMVPPIAKKICQTFKINPLGTIASGALLLTCPPSNVKLIQGALAVDGIQCSDIGHVEAGEPEVLSSSGMGRETFPRPERDEIARVFED